MYVVIRLHCLRQDNHVVIRLHVLGSKTTWLLGSLFEAE